jgi:hypothetical protein
LITFIQRGGLSSADTTYRVGRELDYLLAEHEIDV